MSSLARGSEQLRSVRQKGRSRCKNSAETAAEAEAAAVGGRV